MAAMLSTDHAAAVYDAIDEADAESARPDFSGLIYPVIDMSGPLTSVASRDNLLGAGSTEERRRAKSPQLRVSSATPPCFLVHSADDPVVNFGNSELMHASLYAANIACELHIFQEGRHGYGLGRPNTPSALWPQLFHSWMGRALPALNLRV